MEYSSLFTWVILARSANVEGVDITSEMEGSYKDPILWCVTQTSVRNTSEDRSGKNNGEEDFWNCGTGGGGNSVFKGNIKAGII